MSANMLRRAALAAGLVLVLCGFDWVDPVYRRSTDGNRLYEAGEYDQAHTAYVDAQLEAPQSPRLAYNIGNALYKQGKFEQAVEQYNRVEFSGDAGLEALAAYNAGNAHYRLGQGDPENLIGHWEAAVAAYESALKRNPDLHDAKYNLELVRRKLKELMDQQQSDPDQQQQQDQQQDQQQQPDQPQDGEDQQGEESEPSDSDPSGDEQPEEDTPQPSAEEESGEEEGGEDAAPQGEVRQLTAEEAARLLDALAEQERELDQIPLRLPAGDRRPEVDW